MSTCAFCERLIVGAKVVTQTPHAVFCSTCAAYVPSTSCTQGTRDARALREAVAKGARYRPRMIVELEETGS